MFYFCSFTIILYIYIYFFFLLLYVNWLYFRVISKCISLYAIVILSAGFSRWCCEVKTSGEFQDKNSFSLLFTEIKPFWWSLFLDGWRQVWVPGWHFSLGKFTHEKPSTYSLLQSWRIPVSRYWSNCKCLFPPSERVAAQSLGHS